MGTSHALVPPCGADALGPLDAALQAGLANIARGAGHTKRRPAKRQQGSSFRGNYTNNNKRDGGVFESHHKMPGGPKDLDLTEIFCDTVLSSPLTPLPSLLLM